VWCLCTSVVDPLAGGRLDLPCALTGKATGHRRTVSDHVGNGDVKRAAPRPSAKGTSRIPRGAQGRVDLGSLLRRRVAGVADSGGMASEHEEKQAGVGGYGGGRVSGKGLHAQEEEGDQPAPQRMAREIEALEAVTQELLETVTTSSTPVGRRNGCGADIYGLVRKLLEHNSSAQTIRGQVAEHQARQALVRQKVNDVADAEATMDGIITELKVSVCVLLAGCR